MKKALVIGCGLSGAVVARELAEHGYDVDIIERRNHIAGNMYDYVDEYGILVHKYGPHTFHTKEKNLFEYMKKYAEWEEYYLTCGAEIMGRCTPTPFNFKTIDDFYSKEKATSLKKKLIDKYGENSTATVVDVLNDEDVEVRGYAEFLFEHDYSLYTAKQWGISPQEVDPSILKRVPLRFGYKEGYFDDEYQFMPKNSFTQVFDALLNHENIHVELNRDALLDLSFDEDKNLLYEGKKVDFPVIYTGAIDELYDECYGRLPYRSLRFEWKHEDIDSKQAMPVVAYPEAEGFTRIVEFNKLPVQKKTNGTTYEIEYPLMYNAAEKMEPYYPLLTEESQMLYQKYETLALKTKNLYCCGRLGDFKYYNMDQALKRALEQAKNVLQDNGIKM